MTSNNIVLKANLMKNNNNPVFTRASTAMDYTTNRIDAAAHRASKFGGNPYMNQSIEMINNGRNMPGTSLGSYVNKPGSVMDIRRHNSTGR